MRKRRVLISLLLTLLILFGFYYFIDFKPFLKALTSIRPEYLLVVAGIQFSTYFVRAFRFELILGKKGLPSLFSIASIHFFLNKVLPARAGELSLPILFNKFLEVPYKKGIGALVLFRLLDVVSVMALFSFSLLFVHIDAIDPVILFLAAFLILVSIALFWVRLGFLTGLTLKLIRKIKPGKYEKFKSKAEEFVTQLLRYKKNRTLAFFVQTILVSILTWTLSYLSFFFVIRAFNLDFSVIEVIFATTLANFSLLIPVSVVGSFGTFEAGWAIGFLLLGMKLDMAVSIGLFTNIFTLLLNGLFALAGYFYLSVFKQVNTTT